MVSPLTGTGLPNIVIEVNVKVFFFFFFDNLLDYPKKSNLNMFYISRKKLNFNKKPASLLSSSCAGQGARASRFA